MAKKWNKISEVPPPIDEEVYFLWTDPSMYGHYERGYVTIRKFDGKRYFSYVFCGMLKPTYWLPIPKINFPPMPEEIEETVFERK